MSKLFQLQATVGGVRTTSDKSLELKLHTQDVKLFTPEQLAMLMDTYEKTYVVAFAEQEVKPEDFDPVEITVEKDWKTPSQRLRGVLYRLWEQGDRKHPFPIYYETKMTGIIDQFKEKLD